MRATTCVLLALCAGCGDRLVDGSFHGDATIRIHGMTRDLATQPTSPVVAALWLGYAGLVEPSVSEYSLLPLSEMAFGGAFTCDLLDRPSETGVYKTGDGGRIDAFIRLAQLVVIDDVDGDNRISVTAAGELLAPDLLLARSNDRLLMFVERPAPVGGGQLLTDWEHATPGYHLIAIPPAPRPTIGHTIDNDSTVAFDGRP